MTGSRPATEVVAVFLRLGVVAFGGPAAHIAMMREELVRRRGWVTDERFVDLMGATNLIPGPNSTELAIHLGHERAGWRGLILAGVCFIVPAAVMVGILAWAYVEYGDTPTFDHLLRGRRPRRRRDHRLGAGAAAPDGREGVVARSPRRGRAGGVPARRQRAGGALRRGAGRRDGPRRGGGRDLGAPGARALRWRCPSSPTRPGASSPSCSSPCSRSARSSTARATCCSPSSRPTSWTGSAGSPRSSSSTRSRSGQVTPGRCSRPPPSSATSSRACPARCWRPWRSSCRRSCSSDCSPTSPAGCAPGGGPRRLLDGLNATALALMAGVAWLLGRDAIVDALGRGAVRRDVAAAVADPAQLGVVRPRGSGGRNTPRPGWLRFA